MAKEGVHTASWPLIPTTTRSDNKIPPRSEFSLPREHELPPLSQSLYRACDIFPQATSYHASTIGPRFCL